jgi:hypothetical protein
MIKLHVVLLTLITTGMVLVVAATRDQPAQASDCDCGLARRQLDEAGSGLRAQEKKGKYLVLSPVSASGKPRIVHDLIGKNSIIVVATVEGVVDERLTHGEGNGPSQFTMFKIRVEDSASATPVEKELHLFAGQGHLPWSDKHDGAGLGMRFQDVPLPRVGARYLFVLARFSSLVAEAGPHALDGDDGKPLFSPDDCYQPDPSWGIWEIRENTLVVPEDDEIPALSPRSFAHGPQLLGAGVDSAMSLLRKVLTAKLAGTYTRPITERTIPPK